MKRMLKLSGKDFKAAIKRFNKQSLKFYFFETEKFQQRNRIMKYNQGKFLDLKNIITDVQKKQWD